jgi:hypothetical protein
MSPNLPFVNSVYGDNHDRALMTPLSRAEFVAAASARGLKPAIANRLFSLGGGPDDIYRVIIEVAVEGDKDIVGGCVSILGDSIQQFLGNSLGQWGQAEGEFLGRLALGCLLPAEEDIVSQNLYYGFLAKRTSQGRTISCSPVLSRLILGRGGGSLRIYDECLRAVAAGEFSVAGVLSSSLEPVARHLRAFCGIVGILASLHAENVSGLLGIDWKRIKRLGEDLLRPGVPIGRHLSWIETLCRWARVVEGEATPPGGGRPQLDVLTVRASEPDIREMLLFSMRTYLARATAIQAPAAKIRAIASLPESILQAIASANCGIDFRHAPATLPAFDYGRFFAGEGNFRKPEVGSKLELMSLLVIVSTLLSEEIRSSHKPESLCDPRRVLSIQQKLVEHVRNKNAHTFVDFAEGESKFLMEICEEWLSAMAQLGGYESLGALAVVRSAPTVETLSNLLYGDNGESDC